MLYSSRAREIPTAADEKCDSFEKEEILRNFPPFFFFARKAKHDDKKSPTITVLSLCVYTSGTYRVKAYDPYGSFLSVLCETRLNELDFIGHATEKMNYVFHDGRKLPFRCYQFIFPQGSRNSEEEIIT